jgi:hypothetical protein
MLVGSNIMNILMYFCCSASEWKVPTTFIYGYHDWMNYQGAQQAQKDMKVPCDIIRVPQVSPPALNRKHKKFGQFKECMKAFSTFK